MTYLFTRYMYEILINEVLCARDDVFLYEVFIYEIYMYEVYMYDVRIYDERHAFYVFSFLRLQCAYT